MNGLLALGLLWVSALAIAPRAGSTDDPVAEARELLARERFAEAAALLDGWLRAHPSRADVLDLDARVLSALGRRDEAAHQLARARALLEEAGRAGDKAYLALRRRLYRADPLARKRDALFDKIAGTLGRLAEKLVEEGHAARALELGSRLRAIAREKRRRAVDDVLERARAAFAKVSLDDAGNGAGGAHGLVEHESRFYRIEGDLEREVVERVAATMDDVFTYYVEVYFGGDLDRAAERKATIRIYPTHGEMMKHWEDRGRTVGGWWSSAEWRVVCYDTRSTTGSLDEMLRTLFHEASHQFMTMLSKRGGSTPSWLNEGTACFFEGATAMADGRVLWPDAAGGRLSNLVAMLRTGQGPEAGDVIAYAEPGSYGGEYYPFGWGLVFYLQQFEDPETLEYVWRPYYARYLERITARGGPPLKVFEEVFLAKGNPGDFATFDDFAREWERWILTVVYPVHRGPDRRARRLARMHEYLRAADRAAEERRPVVAQSDLLRRALRDVEYVRGEIDAADAPDGELLLTQADILERLDRKGGAAAAIERVLELAAAGAFPLPDERLAELQDRMARLDRRNATLRLVRLRSASFAARARALLAEYEARDEPLLLRGMDFARAASALFADDALLAERAAALRAQAVAAGLVPSRILRVEGGAWMTIFTAKEQTFTHRGGAMRLAMPARVAGRICLDVPLEGEYEVRGTLRRQGEIYRSSFHGIVVAGSADEDWYAVGLGGRGRLVLKHSALDATGAPTTKTLESIVLQPPIGPEEVVRLAVRVRRDGTLAARFPDRPERPLLSLHLPSPLPSTTHVGLLVKDADLLLEDLVVEVFP